MTKEQFDRLIFELLVTNSEFSPPWVRPPWIPADAAACVAWVAWVIDPVWVFEDTRAEQHLVHKVREAGYVHLFDHEIVTPAQRKFLTARVRHSGVKWTVFRCHEGHPLGRKVGRCIGHDVFVTR